MTIQQSIQRLKLREKVESLPDGELLQLVTEAFLETDPGWRFSCHRCGGQASAPMAIAIDCKHTRQGKPCPDPSCRHLGVCMDDFHKGHRQSETP